MLCIWWNWKGVLYYELLLENQTINYNKYWFQLYQLKAALYKKPPELVNRKHIIFHQDNTRMLVYLMTRQILLQLAWTVLIYPLYSTDTVLSDFHLFWSLIFLTDVLHVLLHRSYTFLSDLSLWFHIFSGI